jgi:hypothetical protein
MLAKEQHYKSYADASGAEDNCCEDQDMIDRVRERIHSARQNWASIPGSMLPISHDAPVLDACRGRVPGTQADTAMLWSQGLLRLDRNFRIHLA